ncbi:MAG: hypothetical protein M3Y42_20845, partial [Actinomycetota bacterium]|nr:hypothetical protein [Actinomycetota bacterium]
MPVVRLLWQVSRPGSVGLGLVVLCRSLLGVGFIVAVGRLLGETVQLGSGAAAADRAWQSFVLLAAIWLAQQVSASAQTLIAGWLSRRCGEYVTELVLDAALEPAGIGHLEDPLTADRLSLAQGVGGDAYPPQTAVSPLAGVVSTRLSAVSSAVLLAGVLWWAPLPVIAGWVVMGAHVGRQFRAQISGLEQRAGTMRRTGYLRRLGTGVDAAKEIRLLGIGGWVADRFSDSWRIGMSELFSRRPAAIRAMAGRTGLLLGAHLLVLGWLAVAAAHGTV